MWQPFELPHLSTADIYRQLHRIPTDIFSWVVHQQLTGMMHTKLRVLQEFQDALLSVCMLAVLYGCTKALSVRDGASVQSLVADRA